MENQRVLLGAVVLASGFLVACPPSGTCSSNKDCPSGVCDTTVGLCTHPSDGGSGSDAGNGTDAGNAVDSGTNVDSGNASDSGTGLDSGNAADSGTGVDSGSASDSGTPADSGPGIDSGTLGDAGCVGCPLNFSALSSGGSYGTLIQTSSSFTNVGNLGEPTPGGVGGQVTQTSSSFTNLSGFNASDPP
jgi:hypothetical protein